MSTRYIAAYRNKHAWGAKSFDDQRGALDYLLAGVVDEMKFSDEEKEIVESIECMRTDLNDASTLKQEHVDLFEGNFIDWFLVEEG